MISSEAWAAWHAGQTLPRESDRETWEKLSQMMSRTAVDIVRQECLANVEREYRARVAERDRLNARILTLLEVSVVLQEGKYGWEHTFANAGVGQ